MVEAAGRGATRRLAVSGRRASATMGRMRTHRPIVGLRGLLAASFAALLLLAAGSTVLAKEGMRATLVGEFSTDATANSTVTLVVDVWVPDPYHVRAPVYGSPIGIRLLDVHGASTEAMGTETSAGSGRYLFSIVMPPGRLIAVRAFIRGTSDLPIAFEPDPLAPATATAPEPPPTPDPGPGPIAIPALAGLIAGLAILAVLPMRARGQPRAV